MLDVLVSLFLFAQAQLITVFRVDEPVPQVEAIDLNSQKMWNIVNTWRKSENLKPFNESSDLCSIADNRVADLEFSFNEDFNHDLLKNRVYEKGLQKKYALISENITGAHTEYAALQFWLRSSSHAKALRDSYEESCVRCKKDFCVQIFGRY